MVTLRHKRTEFFLKRFSAVREDFLARTRIKKKKNFMAAFHIHIPSACKEKET